MVAEEVSVMQKPKISSNLQTIKTQKMLKIVIG